MRKPRLTAPMAMSVDGSDEDDDDATSHRRPTAGTRRRDSKRARMDETVDLGGPTPGVGPAPGLAPVPQQVAPP